MKKLLPAIARILAVLLALSFLPLWVMLIIAILQEIGYSFELVLFAFGSQILGVMLIGKLLSFAFGVKKP